MKLNVGKIGNAFTQVVKTAKPYVTKVGAAIKSLPADMVTLSTSAKKVAKAPKNLLKSLWTVCKKCITDARILAYMVGDGIVKVAGKILKALTGVIKK